MKTRLPILALICSLVASPVQAREAIHQGDVVVVPLRGEVAPSLLAFLRRAVKTAHAAGCAPVVVVIGAHGERVKAELADCEVMTLENAQWATGMGSSIQAGVSALMENFPGAEAAVLMTCDQPLISAAHINALAQVYDRTDRAIVASAYGGSLGVPVLFGRRCFPSLLALDPAEGAKHFILSQAENVVSMSLPEAAFDMDTVGDYERLTSSETVCATQEK